MILQELYDVVEDRIRSPREGSYVSGLVCGPKGLDAALEKLGEEAVEAIVASKNQEKSEVIFEAADLLFHLIVVLAALNISLDEVFEELRRRRS